MVWEESVISTNLKNHILKADLKYCVVTPDAFSPIDHFDDNEWNHNVLIKLRSVISQITAFIMKTFGALETFGKGVTGLSCLQAYIVQHIALLYKDLLAILKQLNAF